MVNKAQRITGIQSKLDRHLSCRERERLVAEQQRLWDTEFPGQPYERIVLLARY